MVQNNHCKTIGFPLYLAIWNREQKQTTPDLHLKIAHWLERCWTHGNKRVLMNVFRGAGKSTLAALFAAWVVSQAAECRILVLSAEWSLSRKMVKNTRAIITNHPLMTHLKPDRPESWASDYFTVLRDKELRDPTMLGRGITSNITGTRADLIICDDVEVPNTCSTAEAREALRERLRELEFILTPGGTILYLGTPHTYYSIYAEKARDEIGEEQAFLNGYTRLKIPIVNDKGESAWPERFTLEDIELQKHESGPHVFASQMMLEPTNILNGRLNPKLLQKYDAELVYYEAQNQIQLKLGDKKIISASAWWDPAFGSAGGDASVVAIVFTDEDGDYWLHHMAYIRTQQTGEDEATQQCKIICDLARKYYLPSVAVETNGIGKFLPSVLRRELAAARLSCAVIEKSSSRAKDERILETLDAVMAAQALYVHKDVYDTPLLNEMQEWRPGKAGGKDDGLDALAGALSLEPVRIKRHYPNKFIKSWRSDTHTANTEFEI